MEKLDKNTIIGLTLMFLMYAGWLVYNDKFGQAPPVLEEAKKEVKVNTPAVPATKATGSLLDSTVKVQISSLSNEVLDVNISNKGAAIQSVSLKKYKSYQDYIAKKENQLSLYKNASNIESVKFQFSSQIINTADLIFSVVQTNPSFIKYTANTASGQLSKTFSLAKNSYELDTKYDLNGISIKPSSIQYSWTNHLNILENNLEENRKAAQINFLDKEGDFSDIGFSSMSDASDDSEIPVKWVSFKQKYFTSGVNIVGAHFEKPSFNLTVPADSNVVKIGNVVASINPTELKNNHLDFKYYFGPNELSTLTKVGNDFQKNLYLGYDIVKPVNKYIFVPLFNWVESFVKNYGLLIILVVLIIKLAVTPLIYKSYVSSAKMRILGPEVAAIKEKVGDDAFKVQQETMKLYQTVGVSPLSGCVPLLLQMPILMSVFFLFPNMIMFRQKNFLWANDLSTYDAPISWATNLPFIGSHISLFVVLMTLSSLAFTYYNNQITPDQPGPVDMKKISYIFPLVFFFVLNSFPAALSFYYLVSNLVTIAQQLIIRKFVDEDKIMALLEQNRKNNLSKPQKKNKFGDFIQKQLQASEEMKKQAEDKKKSIKKK